LLYRRWWPGQVTPVRRSWFAERFHRGWSESPQLPSVNESARRRHRGFWECFHGWCRAWSSKPAGGGTTAPSGFDSHTLPPIQLRLISHCVAPQASLPRKRGTFPEKSPHLRGRLATLTCHFVESEFGVQFSVVVGGVPRLPFAYAAIASAFGNASSRASERFGLRWAFFCRRVVDADLLPSIMPVASGQSGEPLVLCDGGGSASRGLSAVQALLAARLQRSAARVAASAS
jgi:hypothetical protein